METRACPACGARYVATTTVCADCGVDLVDEAPADAEQLGQGDQVAYDLEGWDPDDRVLVDRLLTSEGIRHVWEVATLVVRREDEERVDALLDDLDRGEEEPEDLDPDRPQLEYELEGWTDEQRRELDAVLDEVGVAHAWDEETGVLVVYEDDEAQVEEALDRVEFPDALDADEAADEGTAAQDVMSALFLAADRLLHDPSDADAVLEGVAAADRVAELGTPFGFADDDWSAIVDQATDLKAAIEGDEDDEAVVERATAVRSTLRRYV
ncbi:MAG TPA: hypothetical protein VGB14_05235 [Acidimicrobiales bacterium]